MNFDDHEPKSSKPIKEYRLVLAKRLWRKVESLRALSLKQGLQLNTKFDHYAQSTFSSLPVRSQRKILKDFSTYLEVVYRIQRSGWSKDSEARLLWAFIKEMGWRPPLKLWKELEDEDVIEIYNQDHIQVFRSFSFFEQFQTSIFELLIFDWPSLFKRTAVVEEELLLCMESLLNGFSFAAEPNTAMWEHEVSERLAFPSNNQRLRIKSIVPIHPRGPESSMPAALGIVSKPLASRTQWQQPAMQTGSC